MEYAIKKAVVDTNIFISIFAFPGGAIREIMNLSMKNRVELIISTEILEEFSTVLQKKFAWTQARVLEKIRVIESLVTVCRPDIRLEVVKADKTDNKIIECAVFSKADFIISGDKHLLDLKKHKNILILKPAEFLRIMM